MKIRILLFAVLFFLGATISSTFAEGQKVFYPRPETELDERTGFPLTLLQLIFEHIQNGEKYDLRQTPIAMPRGRALMLLQRNVVVDIFWSQTSVEREDKLLPVRFPIYKGMMGWRVLLIKKGNQNTFNGVQTIKSIRQLIAIQAHDWADYQILEANGLRVQGATSYEELFSLVGRGRADYFPRSVVEVMSEQPYIDKYKLQVEESLILKYPAPMYFFVNKDNLELAKDIEIGLQRAVDNGSYDLLFTSIYEQTLQTLNVDKRNVIELTNPLLPESD